MVFKKIDDRNTNRFEVRGDVTLKVLMTKTEDIQEVQARLINAGPGGLYIETADTLPEGALATLDIRLEGGSLANTLGLIKWVTPGKGGGIEFFYSTEEERDALLASLESWKERHTPKSASTP